MSKLRTPVNPAASEDEFKSYWGDQFAADPLLSGPLTEQWNQANQGWKERKVRGGKPLVIEQGQAHKAATNRAKELGYTDTHDWSIGYEDGRFVPEKANFMERNIDWIAPVAAGALTFGLAAPAIFGANAGANAINLAQPSMASAFGSGAPAAAGNIGAINLAPTVAASAAPAAGGGSAAAGGAMAGFGKFLGKIDPTTAILGGLSLLGGDDGGQERKSFDGTSADPVKILTALLGEIQGLGTALKSRGPVQLRSSVVPPPPSPVSIPGIPFQIGGGLGTDPALKDQTLLQGRQLQLPQPQQPNTANKPNLPLPMQVQRKKTNASS